MIFLLVGYGNIAPTTVSGKLQFIGYIVIGLPLMGYCLTRIGDPMGKALAYAYSRLFCRWCRIRRKKSEKVAQGLFGLKNGTKLAQRKPDAKQTDMDDKWVEDPNGQDSVFKASVDYSINDDKLGTIATWEEAEWEYYMPTNEVS